MKKNKTQYIFYQIVMLIVMCSCTARQELDEYMGQKVLELKLSCTAPNQTRAENEKDGVQDLNENLIRTLHYFFYQSGKTSENAVLAGNMILDDGNGYQNSATIRISVNDEEVNEVLFPRPANECELYVIANLPENVTIPDNTSVDNLKSLSISTDFKTNPTQSSFVMDGLGTVKLIDRNKTLAASAEIPMDRLAAKFSIRISVEDSYMDGNQVMWIPDVDNLSVQMNKAASNTTIGATYGNNLFDFNQRKSTETQTVQVDEGSRVFRLFAPFYSYPRQWDYKSEDAVSFYIMLPWKSEQGNTYQNCYYKVYPNTMQLERNNWYNVDLNIGILGSFNEKEEPIEIDNLTYKVVDWNNGTADWENGLEIDTDLLGAHYLVVDQNRFVLNNKNQQDIPFITSHECMIKDLKVTVPNFGNDSNPKKTDQDITATAQENNWLTLDGSVIRLNHALNNDFINTTDYDYAPYTFTFTLCHKNNPDKFYEEITIVQNPAITIEACLNSDYKASPSNLGGFQFVNGTASGYNGNGADYGGAWGLRGTNTNPNMYVITTTVLPDGSEFILGDPRDVEESNPPGINAANAPGVEGGNGTRRLSWYHKTLTDASVQNMISPKFRIASSYGVTSDVSHTNAINRAATYQEDGYPAGRWRVPTMAEVKFIIKLSSDGKIPTLFTNGSSYWCANGTVTPRTGGGYSTATSTSGNNPVRCVYDDWYWEKSAVPRLTNYSVFTWGDVKEN